MSRVNRQVFALFSLIAVLSGIATIATWNAKRGDLTAVNSIDSQLPPRFGVVPPYGPAGPCDASPGKVCGTYNAINGLELTNSPKGHRTILGGNGDGGYLFYDGGGGGATYHSIDGGNVLVDGSSIFLANSGVASTIRYVDPTGSDTTGNGTQTNPWATPQHAMSVLGSSCTYSTPCSVHMANGTYTSSSPVGMGPYIALVCDQGWDCSIVNSSATGPAINLGSAFLSSSGATISIVNVQAYNTNFASSGTITSWGAPSAGVSTVTGTGFTSSMVGTSLYTAGSVYATNNGIFTVVSFVSATQITVSGAASVTADAAPVTTNLWQWNPGVVIDTSSMGSNYTAFYLYNVNFYGTFYRGDSVRADNTIAQSSVLPLFYVTSSTLGDHLYTQNLPAYSGVSTLAIDGSTWTDYSSNFAGGYLILTSNNTSSVAYLNGTSIGSVTTQVASNGTGTYEAFANGGGSFFGGSTLYAYATTASNTRWYGNIDEFPSIIYETGPTFGGVATYSNTIFLGSSAKYLAYSNPSPTIDAGTPANVEQAIESVKGAVQSVSAQVLGLDGSVTVPGANTVTVPAPLVTNQPTAGNGIITDNVPCTTSGSGTCTMSYAIPASGSGLLTVSTVGDQVDANWGGGAQYQCGVSNHAGTCSYWSACAATTAYAAKDAGSAYGTSLAISSSGCTVTVTATGASGAGSMKWDSVFQWAGAR